MTSRTTFGAELRLRRTQKGLSLAALAVMVNYSKSHLSKIESGVKRASPGLARQCDHALGAGGVLIRLAAAASAATATPPPRTRERVIEIGCPAFRSLDGAGAPAGPVDPDLPMYRALFGNLRAMGQSKDPAAVLRIAMPISRQVAADAANAPTDVRAAAYRLAARFAEYTGWMAQEFGDNDAARCWTATAVRLAADGADREMESYALVREAEILLFQDDVRGILTCAARARDTATGSRIRGLAAQREAQGHALAGDERACREALDAARTLMERADAEEDADASGELPLGATTMADPVAFVTGWCLHDLGRSRAAAQILSTEFDRIPATAHRVRARYGARLALALADQGELDGTCLVTQPVIAAMRQVDSATVRMDLRRLLHATNRQRTRHPDVLKFLPDLTQALHVDGPRPSRADSPE